MIKVFIVDDNDRVRFLMREILLQERDIQVAGEAVTLEEAQHFLFNSSVDIVLMDISLRDRNGGLDFLQAIRQKGITIPFIMISANDEDSYAEWSLKANAQGYICKAKLVQCLVKGVREVYAGGTFVSTPY